MEDIEMVIKGLKSHAEGCGYRSHHCDDMECPYRYGNEECDIAQLCLDALELLNRHGKWVAPEDEGCVIFSNAYVQCSVCGKKSYIGRKDKYCRNCGARMDVNA